VVKFSLRGKKAARRTSPIALNSCNVIFFQGSLDIDEEFILEQFNTDCQNKPNSDVLHVLRLNQVPLELKKNVQLSKLQEAEFFQKPDHERKFQKPQVIAEGEQNEKSKKIKVYKVTFIISYYIPEFWYFRGTGFLKVDFEMFAYLINI
jgi:hypothetical protein